MEDVNESAKLVIAIDFDDTYTADVRWWSQVIIEASKRGHSLICVSSRAYSHADHAMIESTLLRNGCRIPIVFSSGGPKRRAAMSYGYNVDIWIDDQPETVESGWPGPASPA